MGKGIGHVSEKGKRTVWGKWIGNGWKMNRKRMRKLNKEYMRKGIGNAKEKKEYEAYETME